MLPLLMMLTACQTDNGSGSSGNDQADLSGYATLEDLAALQATIDEQANWIEELEAAAAQTATAPRLIMEEHSCGDTSVNYYTAIQIVHIVSCAADSTGDSYGYCTTDFYPYAGGVPYTVREWTNPEEHDGIVATLIPDTTICLNTYRVYYYIPVE